MRLRHRSIRLFVAVCMSSCLLVSSGFAQQPGRRCGTIPSKILAPLKSLPQADCTFSFTDPKAQYDPSVVKYRIPVVVHIIQHTNGDGAISDALVQSQIDVLNEDFLALTGTPGAPGTDIQIEFYLATEDPGGSPTTGITRNTNDTWFIDGGSYWNTLAWDTDEYMNVYTNSGGGALGYVPDLPQAGLAGLASDRIVVAWDAFGRDAVGGPPYDQGRTLSHETGHYLGLEHVFSGGCATDPSPGCYTTGDLICDTASQSGPTFGCPGGTPDTCTGGGVDNVSNYMDYSDDTCMNLFTAEQARRMRCSLENWRPDLFEVATSPSPAIVGPSFAEVGDTVTFSIPSATGTFQWKKNGADLVGEMDPTLILSPVALSDAGTYTAEINDGAKAIITSLPLELYVFPAGSLPVGSAAGLALLGGIAVSAATLRLLRKRS